LTVDAVLVFEVPGGGTLKLVNICVSVPWLKKELGEAAPSFLHFLNELGQPGKHPAVFMEYSPPDEYRALRELNPSALQDQRGVLYLKAKIFSLMADFFTRIFLHSTQEAPDSKILYHEKMLEVEHLLKGHLEKSLPDIGVIARQMALSVSTLKRHFKLMFRKSIYDYYLELKMEHARTLLSEKPLSVNEVACMLDYEKVSSFINIFKKHHGFSPGMLRRKSA
jgi:AraC-like DNA-binding protein